MVGNAVGIVSVSRGNGDGTLAPAQEFTNGFGVFSMAVLDVDLDGKKDVVVGGGDLLVLRGKGDGTLIALESQIYGVGQVPTGVAIDDFDQDGRWDVVTSNSAGGSLSLLRGQEGGALGPQTELAVGGNPSVVIAEDLDNDGATDLVWLDTAGSRVFSRLGNGDGTFQASIAGPSGVAKLVGVRDMDGDGIPDLVLNAESPSIAMGHGDGTFGAPAAVPGVPANLTQVADLNADGSPDLVALGDGDYGGDPALVMTAGISNGSGSFVWGELGHWCNEPGCWHAIPAVLATRLNGDYFDDFAMSFEDHGQVSDGVQYHVASYLGPGFQSLPSFQYNDGDAGSLETADFDGDGNTDLAFTRDRHTGVFVLIGNAVSGPSVREGEYFGGTSPAGLASADLNDDGRPDLVVADEARNQVRVLLNQGTSTSAPRAPRHLRAFPGNQSILVKWRPILKSGLLGYRVYYGAAGTSPPLQGGFATEGPSGILVPPSESFTRLHCPAGTRVAVSVRAVGPDGRESLASETVGATPSATLDALNPGMPSAFALASPRPNPAGRNCDLVFDLPRASPVRLDVFDVRGRLVARLVDATLPAGRHSARWRSSETSPGLYFARMSAGSFRDAVRIVVTR